MGRLETPVERATYDRAFKECAAALRDAGIPFACMGSLALWALGGPIPNLQQDLDFAICEADAVAAATALRDAGMSIEVPDEDWLFKAWTGKPMGRDSALIDLIYAPAGLEITRELLAGCEYRNVLAIDVPVLGATDLIVTKLLAITEQSADYSSVLQFARSLREQVDWDDLERRVRDTPFGEAFVVMAERLGLHTHAEPVHLPGVQRGSASNGDGPVHPARFDLLRMVNPDATEPAGAPDRELAKAGDDR
jgi:hypothetical protein